MKIYAQSYSPFIYNIQEAEDASASTSSTMAVDSDSQVAMESPTTTHDSINSNIKGIK